MSNPRLVAISGVSKGTSWSAAHGPLFLGRDASNQVEVTDPAVSRKHCSISLAAGGRFEVADLESHNGTFVNGVRVSRKVLQHRDRVRIGSSEYLFLTDDGAEKPASGGPRTMHLDRSGLLSDSLGINRMARDLNAFFKIANVINSTRDAQALQQELLALISEVIPASQGAVVLQPAGNEEAAPPCTWNGKGNAGAEMVIRQDLINQAAWERSAVFTVGADNAAEENVLCLPLTGVERVLGAIYLSSPASSPGFTEEHAFFLSAVSRIAAVTLENLAQMESLRTENQQLRAEGKTGATLIGESRPMQRVWEFIARVSKGNSTVLIHGESGTGKELIARALHQTGLQPHKPFVAINCAAIPEALLESELFGHEKGAFTGAVGLKKGKFEAVEDGTLFLDEIGEMAPLLQAKLLRVLQQREFERVGGNRLLPFNARVVAATNKNLLDAIKAGQFRQDLYYRLNVISVASPPLRERREDIPLLALHFANKYAARCKRGFKGIIPEARRLLMQYSWPGNVRELENAIEHAIVMGLTDEILPEDLPSALIEEQSPQLEAARYHHTLNLTKKQLVLTALDEAGGSPIEAARLLGIHPKYLHRLIHNLDITYESKRAR